ncbi:hypothetical protein GGR42_001095 [Saonia flava]|uniref:DUF4369 domain-containing protein n=1 Tax=Saonia flava TaxID=523696 RepID=A0A846QWH9_9FLAO|nr:DUF4369 domain-containing protein [Saonia flava]NJB70633.1 hypothetical protein [Saonia flava]
MKKSLFMALICALIIACANDTENTMTVTGTVKGLKKGVLYLQKVPDSTVVTIDSLQIEGDGNFTFKTELESPEIFYLYLSKEDNNDINDRITFFGEPGVITINTAWNTFDTNAKITGSQSHEKLEEYRKVMSRYTKKNLEILQIAYDPKIPKDSLVMDSIKKVSDRNILGGYLYSINFAINNKDSYIAPYIAVKEVPDANKKYLDSIHNVLTPEVANSKYGKELTAYLERIK